MPERSRLLIVEDHVMFAEVLADLLRGRHEVLGVAHTSSEAVELAERFLPELVLLDIALGHDSGFDLVPRLKQLVPGCRFLVVTNFNHTEFQARAHELGVQGFVSKTESVSCLEETIQIVVGGGTRYGKVEDDLGYVPSSVSSAVHLTPRQVDVLRQLARGLTYKEIAMVTGLSENTVDVYLRRIRRALGAHKPVDLVSLARQHGFLPPGSERVGTDVHR